MDKLLLSSHIMLLKAIIKIIMAYTTCCCRKSAGAKIKSATSKSSKSNKSYIMLLKAIIKFAMAYTTMAVGNLQCGKIVGNAEVLTRGSNYNGI